ncbi:hypothetical protein L0P88_13755 [Muricauda sp. SCSIO 64092]|uniref:hypothetical protein n=1 Tax=Allomuricauda sp. SCSIO 64092 TaxID=2908842 RepID=UPI001FF45B84|nr:hypothetical protein [Muricauda sp. SCSIO 64092]UOY05017.1 hypothetical protein L0P88_13755 [Muricauda sp. SCSIO 64092]
MKPHERFFKLLKYLAKNHPDIDLNNLHDEAGEKATLSAIKEFAGYDYNPEKKFFIINNEEKKLVFATENVELEEIKSAADLYHAINYLNEAYDKRIKSMEQQVDLPKRLFLEPKEVQDISRKNIMNFLQETYQINNEEELFALEEQKHKEVIYDLYRTFTGYTPRKDFGGIMKSIPNESDVVLSHRNLPDFQNDTLFSHIRDMRKTNEDTQQRLQETTSKRLEEIKEMMQSSEQQEQNQEAER